MENKLKLTTEEATRLINLLKYKIENPTIEFPAFGKKIEFEVVAKETPDKFTININRGNKNVDKCTYQGRTSTSNVPLLRLDIGKTIQHMNPDGGKIMGNHLHIYTEEYEMGQAVSFNISDPDLYNNCLEFFKKFNLLMGETNIIYQEQLA